MRFIGSRPQHTSARSHIHGSSQGLPRKLVATAAAVLILSAGSISGALAATGTATQNVTMTVTGTLTVSATNPTIAVGSVAAGASNLTSTAGDLTYVNTLNSGSAWSVTVASTDLVQGTQSSPCTASSGCVTAAGLGYSPGNAGALTAGAGGLFSIPMDPSPGTTFSQPLTLATGTSAQQGTFNQVMNSYRVNTPVGTKPGSYTGTVQYTITG